MLFCMEYHSRGILLSRWLAAWRGQTSSYLCLRAWADTNQWPLPLMQPLTLLCHGRSEPRLTRSLLHRLNCIAYC